jgi:hypothetical protein
MNNTDRSDNSDHECLQESPAKKAAWLEEAQRRWPVGARVKVAASDLEEYIGLTGVVTDYDVGESGDWPLVTVKFDMPLSPPHDGFYDDELVAVGETYIERVMITVKRLASDEFSDAQNDAEVEAVHEIMKNIPEDVEVKVHDREGAFLYCPQDPTGSWT